METEWSRALPVLVQSGGGAILCLIGIWAGIKSGYLDLKLPDDRKVILWMIGGFLFLLLLTSAFTFWLPHLDGGATS